MTIKRFVFAFAIIMLVSVVVIQSSYAQFRTRQPLDATSVLTAAKSASGGYAWNLIQTLHGTAIVTHGGITGDYEEWADLASGRNAATSTLGSITTAQGYDGRVVWHQDLSGQSYVISNATYSKLIDLDAYMVDLFSKSLSTAGDYARRIEENQHDYVLLQLNPQTTLWINADTALIDRAVTVLPEQTVTTYYSDYQKVLGVLLPFQVRQSNGTMLYDTTYTYRTIEANVSIPNTRFSQPQAPAPDYTFDGGKTSISVPFRYSGALLSFDITINGQGPLSAVLDTGGSFTLPSDVAKRLGLKPQGAIQANGFGAGSADMGVTRVDELRFGDLRIMHPLCTVGTANALDKSLIFVGQELFNRFVVRIDYDRHLLTFTRPEAFVYHGDGAIVPFRFNEFNGSTPEVDGIVDGIPGAFSMDTGDGNSLTLTSPFVISHDLQAKYHTTFTVVTGYGIGGETHGALARVHTLSFGGVTAHDLVTDLTSDTAGFGSVNALAGNIGEGVLCRFNVIFDYSRRRIVFEKNSHYGEPDIFNRSGLGVLESGLVVVVIPNSPAAEAGIHAGDTVLKIGDQSPATLTSDGIRNVFHQPVGTVVHLKVRSETQTRDVTILLRELI